ncbi:uncharacterized protein EAE98_002724 [Botrytis deweyae]|uniref:Uncharacterized protein n=1 Tax=Botrytis deweyae TaxID=2478750 RepID=A0ABQ7IUK5_9HELO|nr:uncharacterized protein EAE98_002724 [Botrytis deweyae]KAF7934679.1 hypothetical protein EAE98_002724 [Botrytis deweyae]
MKHVREDGQSRMNGFIFTQLQRQYIFGAISGDTHGVTRAVFFPTGMPCGFKTIEYLIQRYMGTIWHGTLGE